MLPILNSLNNKKLYYQKEKHVLLVRTIQSNTGSMWPFLFHYLSINNNEYFCVCAELCS